MIVHAVSLSLYQALILSPSDPLKSFLNLYTFPLLAPRLHTLPRSPFRVLRLSTHLVLTRSPFSTISHVLISTGSSDSHLLYARPLHFPLTPSLHTFSLHTRSLYSPRFLSVSSDRLPLWLPTLFLFLLFLILLVLLHLGICPRCGIRSISP